MDSNIKKRKLYYEDPDEKDFECTICLDPQYNVVHVCENGHWFCTKCFEKHRNGDRTNCNNCPTCNCNITGRNVSLLDVGNMTKDYSQGDNIAIEAIKGNKIAQAQTTISGDDQVQALTMAYTDAIGAILDLLDDNSKNALLDKEGKLKSDYKIALDLFYKNGHTYNLLKYKEENGYLKIANIKKELDKLLKQYKEEQELKTRPKVYEHLNRKVIERGPIRF